MIERPLRIVRCEKTARHPEAWLLPGSDPARWLEDLSGADLCHADIRLLLVPASISDRSPAGQARGNTGALVVRPGGISARPGPRALPYALAGPRLYVPRDAAIEPEVAPDEIEAQLPGRTAVLHPSAGLVGFEETDALPASALLEVPPRRPADWHRARPGVPPAPALRSVEPAEPPRALGFIEDGRDEIGSKPPGEAPAAPGEPARGMVPGLGRAIQGKAARAVKWFARRAARTASGPTWVDRLEGWAESILRSIERLAEKRLREVERLLDLLRRDPDQGLRYALPLRDLGSRGVAPPGAQLPPRDADFRLDRLRGGRPGDTWSVPRSAYAELHRLYREAANRELRLGRFRRAAYILAELLGDLDGAAAVLVEGGYYREAAALYLEHLKKPLEAARALEKGGLLAEAAAIYRAEKAYEKAGDLLARIDRAAEAEAAYREAVAISLLVHDFAGAGRILERKVRSVDEALATYAAGWPSSGQAQTCLEARCDLLGRLGRHAETTSLIQSLRSAELPRSRDGAACRVLARVAGSYPDQESRRAAADAVLVIASRSLDGAAIEEAEKLVECVTGLEPRDRLLERDGTRYIERLRAEELARARAAAAAALLGSPRRGARAAATLVRSFRLPEGVEWSSAVSAGDCLWCAGHARERRLGHSLFIARSSWEGTTRPCWSEPLESFDILMAPCPPELCFALRGRRPRMLSVCEDIPRSSLETPEWLPRGILGLAWDQGSRIWTAELEHRSPVVKCFETDGKFLSAHTLSLPAAADAPIDPPGAIVLAATRDVFYAGVARRLFRIRSGADRQPAAFDLDHEIIAIAPSPSHSVPRAAVLYERGGAVVWAGKVEGFAADCESARATFTADGRIVVVCRGEGRIYTAMDLEVRHRGDFQAPSGREIAVLPGPRSDEFAVVTREGEVSVYRAEP